MKNIVWNKYDFVVWYESKLLAQGQLKPLIQTQTGLQMNMTCQNRKDNAKIKKLIGTNLKVQNIMPKQTWNIH